MENYNAKAQELAKKAHDQSITMLDAGDILEPSAQVKQFNDSDEGNSEIKMENITGA